MLMLLKMRCNFMDAKMSKLMENLPDIMDYSKTTTIDDLNAKFEIPGDMNKDNICDLKIKPIRQSRIDKIIRSKNPFPTDLSARSLFFLPDSRLKFAAAPSPTKSESPRDRTVNG